MTTRRDFLVTSLGALAAAATASSQAVGPVEGPIVQTPLGPVRGESLPRSNVFRGLPYAEPPVGKLRFRSPEPVKPWKQTLDATRFAPAALQSEPRGPQEAASQSASTSENCLYLNVWAPKGKGPFPVFVWVHGGGLTGGRSSDPRLDGAHFAKDGVICVTIAYRLGAFGFLDVTPLLGDTYTGSANNGLRDVVAALRWVHENISAFGGDPTQVTVGGQSAGAKLADLVLAVPGASGYFRQVVSESGGEDRVSGPEKSLETAEGFARVWRGAISGSTPSLALAASADILAVQERFTKDWPTHFSLRPVVDGKYLPINPLDALRKGAGRGKRLLLGTNADESANFIGAHPVAEPVPADLANMNLAGFQTIRKRYDEIHPDWADQKKRIRSVSAEEYWIPSMRMAEAHVNGGGTAFVYRFDVPSPDGRFAGLAYHGEEVAFVWQSDAGVPAAMKALSETMHQAWIAFLKGAKPQAEGLPMWPAYEAKTRPTMIFDTPSHVDLDPMREEFDAWAGTLN